MSKSAEYPVNSLAHLGPLAKHFDDRAERAKRTGHHFIQKLFHLARCALAAPARQSVIQPLLSPPLSTAQLSLVILATRLHGTYALNLFPAGQPAPAAIGTEKPLPDNRVL